MVFPEKNPVIAHLQTGCCLHVNWTLSSCMILILHTYLTAFPTNDYGIWHKKLLSNSQTLLILVLMFKHTKIAHLRIITTSRRYSLTVIVLKLRIYSYQISLKHFFHLIYVNAVTFLDMDLWNDISILSIAVHETRYFTSNLQYPFERSSV